MHYVVCVSVHSAVFISMSVSCRFMKANVKKMKVLPVVRGLTAHLQAADLCVYFVGHTLLPSCRPGCIACNGTQLCSYDSEGKNNIFTLWPYYKTP